MATAYLGNHGLKKIAEKLNGNENIYLGIRPYGFHAGNKLVLITYPLLLCRELQKRGTKPEFNFYIFINDYEQAKADGPDIKTYPFDIIPFDRTFQYTNSVEDPSTNIVDYWQPVIESEMSVIKKEFRFCKLNFFRNSELKNNPTFKKHVYKTIELSDEIAEVLERNSNHDLFNRTGHRYVRAVCPKCLKARTDTNILDADNLEVFCPTCSTRHKLKYDDIDFWFYHKPLAIPRLEIFEIDLCITGIDHYYEGDLSSRPELIKLMCSEAIIPETLYAPGIMVDGVHMGKSKGNIVDLNLQQLIALCEFETDNKISITKDSLLKFE